MWLPFWSLFRWMWNHRFWWEVYIWSHIYDMCCFFLAWNVDMGTAVWWYKIEVDFLFWIDDWVALNFTCFLHRFRKKAVVPPNFQPQELGIDINKTPENLMYDHEDAPRCIRRSPLIQETDGPPSEPQWNPGGRCFDDTQRAVPLRPGNYPLRSSLNTKAWTSTLLCSGKGLNFLLQPHVAGVSISVLKALGAILGW